MEYYIWCFVTGLLIGIAIGQIIREGRTNAARAKCRELEEEMLSGLKHEAELRKQVEQLTMDNAYLRSKNERRKMYATLATGTMD